MRLLIILLLFFAGCSSTITEIGPLLPKSERPVNFIAPLGKTYNFRKQNTTIDSFLKYHFTDDAYYYLKDIPLVDGPCSAPYAAGVNFWSSAASFLSLNGIGRKVILNPEMLFKYGKKALIHEYVHHLDDLTRDGEANFINLDEFKLAYARLAKESHLVNTHENYYIRIMTHLDKIKVVERSSNIWFTNTFGVGDMAEHIAYSSHMILGKKDVPDYFKRVYRKVFRVCENLE